MLVKQGGSALPPGEKETTRTYEKQEDDHLALRLDPIDKESPSNAPREVEGVDAGIEVVS